MLAGALLSPVLGLVVTVGGTTAEFGNAGDDAGRAPGVFDAMEIPPTETPFETLAGSGIPFCDVWASAGTLTPEMTDCTALAASLGSSVPDAGRTPAVFENPPPAAPEVLSGPVAPLPTLCDCGSVIPDVGNTLAVLEDPAPAAAELLSGPVALTSTLCDCGSIIPDVGNTLAVSEGPTPAAAEVLSGPVALPPRLCD